MRHALFAPASDSSQSFFSLFFAPAFDSSRDKCAVLPKVGCFQWDGGTHEGMGERAAEQLGGGGSLKQMQRLMPAGWADGGNGDGALKILLALPVGRGRDRDDDLFRHLSSLIALEVARRLNFYSQRLPLLFGGCANPKP